MKEEYIVMGDDDFDLHMGYIDIHTARSTAEEACEKITSGYYVVLKVVGRATSPGKVVWDSDFEGE